MMKRLLMQTEPQVGRGSGGARYNFETTLTMKPLPLTPTYLTKAIEPAGKGKKRGKECTLSR